MNGTELVVNVGQLGTSIGTKLIVDGHEVLDQVNVSRFYMGEHSGLVYRGTYAGDRLPDGAENSLGPLAGDPKPRPGPKEVVA